MKSSNSMLEPPLLSDESNTPRVQKVASQVPSCASMKSSNSMFEPPTFSNEANTHSCGVCGDTLREAVSISCGHSFCSPCISKYWDSQDSSEHYACPQCRKRSKTRPLLKISNNTAMHFLNGDLGPNVIQRFVMNHKIYMRKKFKFCFEGVTSLEQKNLLNNIYTQLYITEGETEGINKEHEVLQMETSPKGSNSGLPINCNDIFKALPELGLKEIQLKTVLTKGIAGIGKTVSVQKFVLDWAEGKTNQDVDFMFVIPFRELNLMEDEAVSLQRLLSHFHPELENLDPKMYSTCKTVIIFDGLDESRIPFMKTECKTKVSDVTMRSSVSVLLKNLIEGQLLPSTFIWITSRPAAVSLIPNKYISRMTEIQGFNDAQKEEYFKKRISDPDQATKVFSHIIQTKTLYIMCHIPIFCWISATVIQELLKTDAKIPKTLTEMYIHFMLIQTNTKSLKYPKDQKDPKMILKLAKLAFRQLIMGNIIFYEEDLSDCGIDVNEATVYSGICTSIFKEESIFNLKKVYSFVHLSFQEFFAAMFVYHSMTKKDYEILKVFQDGCSTFNGTFAEQFLMCVTHKALKSETGQLDLFLRFLHGIADESNIELLSDTLRIKSDVMDAFRNNIQFIKQKKHKKISPERWNNLIYCFSEKKDNFFQIEAMTSKIKNKRLSQWDCTTMAHMLQEAPKVQDELAPKKYKTSEGGYMRLLTAVRNCKKAFLSNMNLTKQHIEIVVSALRLENSPLKLLDLSYNDIQDSNIELLCVGLQTPGCTLETLRLVMCNLTEQTCKTVAEVLHSANSHLIELDLSQNDLTDSGVKLLSEGLKSLDCKLEILRFSGCMITEDGCIYLVSALNLNPTHLKELDLSYNHPGYLEKRILCAMWDELKTLNSQYGGECRIRPGPRKYAFELTPDLNTLSNCVVCKDNRTVMFADEIQSYPDHPDRFMQPQVLCKERLTGRCYWEAECQGRKAAFGVAYKGTIRSKFKSDNIFGCSKRSWSLFCYKNSYAVRHDNIKKLIPAGRFHSSRVGVYVDCQAGILSYYSVSGDTLKHIHTFQCCFTEPLYAGFYVYPDSSSYVSLCHV